jgi:hypothetical protein
LLSAAIVLTFGLVGACAFLTPPIPNPAGLPSDALTLQYVLDQGCFPYMLGEKSETAAMHGLRLNHFGPGPSLTPPGPPHWLGSYPGLSTVVVGRDSCSVVIHGSNIAAYRTATQIVLRRRFGPAVVEQDAQSGYAQVLPGQITGCRGGLRYTYYQDRGRPWFSVDMNRVADCATDPLRSFRPFQGPPPG